MNNLTAILFLIWGAALGILSVITPGFQPLLSIPGGFFIGLGILYFMKQREENRLE